MEEQMPYLRYRLCWADGAEAGEDAYVSRVRPDELIWIAGGQKLRVLDVVEEASVEYAGLLKVEPA
jgi:hypothetical protein